MLVIKREGKRKEVAAERNIYKALIVEVQVVKHWCHSSCPTAPRFSTADKCVFPIVSLKKIQRLNHACLINECLWKLCKHFRAKRAESGSCRTSATCFLARVHLMIGMLSK